MRLIVQVVIFLYLHQVCAHREFSVTATRNQNDTKTIKCISDIMKVLKMSATVIKPDNGEKDSLIDEIIQGIAKEQIPVTITDNLTDVDKLWDSVVVMHVTCDSLEQLDVTRAIKRLVKYVAVVPAESGPCVLRELAPSVAAYHVTFLVEDALQAAFPRLHPTTCLQLATASQRLTACTHISHPHHVFPRKLITNFHGCPFRFGFRADYPYAYTVQPGVPPHGVDIEISKLIASRVNATPSYFPTNANVGGTAYYDFLFETLENGTVDSLLGGIVVAYLKDGELLSEYTTPYSNQNLFWIYSVHRSQRSLESLIQRFVNVYPFVIFYLFSSCVWYMVRYVDGKAVSLQRALLVHLGALLGTSSLQHPHSHKQKFLFIIFSLSCIYFSTFVSTQMYTFLVIEKPPVTYDNEYDLFTRSDMTVYINGELSASDVQAIMILRNAKNIEWCEKIECIIKAAKHNGITTSFSNAFLYIQEVTAKDDELRMMKLKENMFSAGISMVTRRQDLRGLVVQQWLRWLRDTGLVAKLHELQVGEDKLSLVRRLTKNTMSNSYACAEGCSIRLSDVTVMFYAWVAGCTLATGALLIELLIVYFVKTRRGG